MYKSTFKSGGQSGYKPVTIRGGVYMPVKARAFTAGTSGSTGSQANLSAAFDVIKEEEGLRTEAYQDQTGKWTIGFGNTVINGRPVQQGDRITKSQAAKLMQDSVVKNYTTFAKQVRSSLSPSQFAALTSFEYNLGSGIWKDASGRQILAAVDAGDFKKAGQLMLAYNKSRNPQTRTLEVNPVLAARRKREAQMLGASSRVAVANESDMDMPLGRGYTPLNERAPSMMRV